MVEALDKLNSMYQGKTFSIQDLIDNGLVTILLSLLQNDNINIQQFCICIILHISTGNEEQIS